MTQPPMKHGPAWLRSSVNRDLSSSIVPVQILAGGQSHLEVKNYEAVTYEADGSKTVVDTGVAVTLGNDSKEELELFEEAVDAGWEQLNRVQYARVMPKLKGDVGTLVYPEAKVLSGDPQWSLPPGTKTRELTEADIDKLEGSVNEAAKSLMLEQLKAGHPLHVITSTKEAIEKLGEDAAKGLMLRAQRTIVFPGTIRAVEVHGHISADVQEEDPFPLTRIIDETEGAVAELHETVSKLENYGRSLEATANRQGQKLARISALFNGGLPQLTDVPKLELAEAYGMLEVVRSILLERVEIPAESSLVIVTRQHLERLEQGDALAERVTLEHAELHGRYTEKAGTLYRISALARDGADLETLRDELRPYSPD